ncbi:MAG: O-methyltransferase [Cyclobacteriaceae bacterium]|nr:O-methyltransferase [Cyclobacteriaceae bacterium]
MDFIPSELSQYAEGHTSTESELLKRINRETHAQVMMPRMLSGHLQGRLLAMISKMIKPSVAIEIGTYTGYSALCLAEGLAKNGNLITIDINEELESRVRGYFEASPWSKQIDYRIGDAAALLPMMPGPFDLVWLDADKENYGLYYDLVIDKVPSGGWILADNVLWSGKIIDTKPDKDTRALQQFNDRIRQDPRVETVLLPVRDGIMIIRKM